MGRKRPDWLHVDIRANPSGPSGPKLVTVLGLLTALILLSAALVNNAEAWRKLLPWSTTPAQEAPRGGLSVQSAVSVAARPDSTDGSGQELLDVSAGGPGFIAVGWTVDQGQATSGSDGAVWLSKRGDNWTPAPDDQHAFQKRPGDQKLSSVVRYQGGFVAVGESGGAAAIYVSKDGRRWSHSSVEDSSDRNQEFMRAVTARGTVLVAVGARWVGGRRVAAAWTARDGGRWQRARMIGRNQAPAVIHDVVATKSKFVAVGRVASPSAPNRYRAAIWTSADGRSWTLLSPQAISDPECPRGTCTVEQFMRGVVAFKGKLVAVGAAGPADCQRVGAVWTSTDGSQWRRSGGTKMTGGVELNGVAASGPRIVAVGHRVCEGSSVVTAWTSADGTRWQRLPGKVVGTDPGSMAAAAIGQHAGVIVGSNGRMPDAQGLSWGIKIT